MNQLDLFSAPPPRLEPIQGLTYAPDLLTDEQEARILEVVDRLPWLDDLKRRVQHYGYKYDYKARAISADMRVGPLPEFALEVARLLVAKGLLDDAPDQMIVNEYLPGQGISSHVDCEPCFKAVIATVSLGSPCHMTLIEKANPANARTQPLARRSALSLRGPARYGWLHGIKGRLADDGVPRRRRVSLTFRNVIL